MSEEEKKISEGESRYHLDKKQLNNHLNYLISSDTKYAIIYVLDLYEMLNLKALAKIIGKSQSTIHKHLEDLMEREYIQIANTMKGKFYETTDLVQAINEYQDQLDSERDIEKELEDLRQLDEEQFLEFALDQFDNEDELMSPHFALHFREFIENSTSVDKIVSQVCSATLSETYLHIYFFYLLRLVKRGQLETLRSEFERITVSPFGDRLVSYLEREELEIAELNLEQIRVICVTVLAEKKYRHLIEAYSKDEEVKVSDVRKHFPIASFDHFNYFLKLSSLEQLVRLIEVFVTFYQDIKRLTKEFNAENEGVNEDLLTTQTINFFAGPLSKDVN